jgi:hypothetical protein
MEFELEINSIDWKIEKEIKNKLNLRPPVCYAEIEESELNKIYLEIFKELSLKTKNLLKQIILSIRGNEMRNHMMITHNRLLRSEKNIINDYKNGIDIIDLVKKYDGSPLNLLRIIFQKKYNNKLTKLIKENNKLDSSDSIQLKKAIQNDTYALINQDNILNKSLEFEKKIENILIINKIKFKTQEQLSNEQKKESGIATNTPDFLILNNLYINKNKINWIDAKNFYGSNLSFLIKKMIKQTKKYIKEWGPGAIIFNLSFNSKLKIEKILFIDYDSFSKLT